ncbi:MAG: acyl carrier protein [Jatrophihabitantaceae bacterium]
MDTPTTVDLKVRVLAAVLAAGRQAFRQEVDETLDPIAAGFDSISAMELAAVLEEKLGVDCTLEDVFDATSLAALADVLVRRIDVGGGR